MRVLRNQIIGHFAMVKQPLVIRHNRTTFSYHLSLSTSTAATTIVAATAVTISIVSSSNTHHHRHHRTHSWQVNKNFAGGWLGDALLHICCREGYYAMVEFMINPKNR